MVSIVAVWQIVMRWFDLVWCVEPAFAESSAANLLMFAVVTLVLGIPWVAVFFWRCRTLVDRWTPTPPALGSAAARPLHGEAHQMADHEATSEELIPRPPAPRSQFRRTRRITRRPMSASRDSASSWSRWRSGSFVGGLVYWQYRRFEWVARANDPTPIPRADERRPRQSACASPGARSDRHGRAPGEAGGDPVEHRLGQPRREARPDSDRPSAGDRCPGEGASTLAGRKTDGPSAPDGDKEKPPASGTDADQKPLRPND